MNYSHCYRLLRSGPELFQRLRHRISLHRCCEGLRGGGTEGIRCGYGDRRRPRYQRRNAYIST